MVSLYNRATPSQRRILRAVEGAVKNAADAHPELQFTPRMARSIAKRAAGTLTAQWPDVLAAQMPSGRADEAPSTSWPPGSQFSKNPGRGSQTPADLRPQLRAVWKRFSVAVGEAKRAGNTERAQALIEALKAINEIAASA